MNLYEILEVSETASEETINKIYKIQAKRFHPDLQKTQEEKLKAEEKMKKINDAYNVLSDEQKRKEYDEKLKAERNIREQENRQKIINEATKQYKNSTYNAYYKKQQVVSNSANISENNNQNKQVYTKKDYIRDYNKKLRKLKFKNWKERVILNLKVILIMILIITFLWFFPPSHKFIIKMYEENIILQAIVEMFIKMVNSFRTGL